MIPASPKKQELLRSSCVWVTGATSGIGQALVGQLVEAGNFVVASGRNKAVLGQLAAQYGAKVKPLVFDVADGSNLVSIASALNEITDYLDCVIACAGICEYEDTLLFDPAMYERVFNVNFLGVIRTLNIAKPLLEKSKLVPQFVAVGSLSSTLPFPRAEAYGAAKAAVEYFIKSARIDHSHRKLEFVLVRPGFVSTPLVKDNDFAMPFLVSPEQAATRIIRGIKSRKKVIDFPKRLSFFLRFISLFEALWIRWAGPSLTRFR